MAPPPKRRQMKPLTRAYFWLAFVATIGASLFWLSPSSIWAEAFGPNLATEAVGVLLTLLLVQRALDEREQRQRRRASRFAVRRVREALARLLSAFADLIRGCALEPPEEPIITLDELLTNDHADSLANCRLDERSTSGLATKATVTWSVERSRTIIRDTIAAYGSLLDPDFLEAIDALYDDDFVLLLGEGRLSPAAPPLAALSEFLAEPARRLAFARLRRAIDLHNAHPYSVRPIGVPHDLWGEFQTPELGSLRSQS